MLTTEQRADFAERGFLRLREAFSRADAAAMEAHVWGWLERRFGHRRDAPATWTVQNPTGLKGMKRAIVYDAIGGETTCAALDELLGAGRWQRPRDWGQFLVNFPRGGSWTVPARVWHTDFAFRGPFDPPRGALVFSFVSEVPAGSGGTVVVAGSHRVIAKFLATRPSAGREKMKVTRHALLRSDPWLKALTGEEEGAQADRSAWLAQPALVEGVPVQVVELCGQPGDVVIGHPWLLHAGAPNCGSAPRLMRVQRVHATGLGAPAAAPP